MKEPLIPPFAKTFMTNSGKYAHYGPDLTGRRFYFGSIAECDVGCEHRSSPQSEAELDAPRLTAEFGARDQYAQARG
jgi:hypothetical protein